MAYSARNRLAPATFGNQIFTFLNAANGCVCDERGPWVTQCVCRFHVHRYFDDALAERFGLAPLKGKEQASRSSRLRHAGRLDDLDPRRPFHGRKILGSSLDFVVAHGLGEADHPIGIRLSWLCTFSDAVLEVVHLLHEVSDRKPRDAGVFRTTLAIWIMAETAGGHVRFSAMRHNMGHCRVVFWKPVSWTETITDLRQRKRRTAARKVP